jgi:hypothetical protein
VDHPHWAFVVQSVFTPTRWCRWRLTKKGVATAFDVPHQVVETCSEEELGAFPKHPSRVLEHCAKLLLVHEGIIQSLTNIPACQKAIAIFAWCTTVHLVA